MANIGTSILTNVGQTALMNATVSNPINIATFTVSNTTSNLDPTTTNFTGWITKTVTGLTLINDNTVEITCVVEPDEASDIAASVGIFLSDGTLFLISNPSSPIPPGMRQVIKTQIIYTNCGSLVNFNYLPWGLENLTLLTLDNQVSMLNNIWQLSSKNQIYDTLANDYYTHKSSDNNYRDIYVDMVYGTHRYFSGSTDVIPLASIDYSIQKNKTFKFVRYNLVEDETNPNYTNVFPFLTTSHELYDNNILFRPYIYINDPSTSNINWRVFPRSYPLYQDAFNIAQNIDKYIVEFTDPEYVNSTINLVPSISYASGRNQPGYWVACLPINLGDNTLLETFNLQMSVSDCFQLYTYDYSMQT
ncbi:MAG: hypothetical protein ACPLX8_01915, partial [Nanopusillaceae archaeon]